MARDAELDRLKAAQDLAFQRKQDAYQEQQRAWERRSSTRDDMNRAHEAKQRAYTEQDRTWQYYQSVRSSNGPRIDSLNDQQERAFQNMKSAFESASAAHDRRDGAGAASYAADGHRYKAEAQGCVAERRLLVEEIRSAREVHEATKPAFQRAKDDFNAARRAFDSAKQEHERAQGSFKQAKEAFDAASKAFRTRLEAVKAEGKKRNEDRRSLAEKAGVPFQYLDRVWVSKKPDGSVNLYFGGIGQPNGPGYGHYTMDARGEVTYKREPFDPHGNENFVRDADLEQKLAQIALESYHRYHATIGRGALDAYQRDQSATGPRAVQYDDGSVSVKVKSGFNRRTNTVATDVIVIDRLASPDEHLHLILSEHDGSVLFQEWRKNH